MPVRQETRDLARNLITSETDASPASLQTEPVTMRVYERLRRQLGAPVGVDGFHVLASRALALAKSESPRLSAVQIAANGCLRGLDEVESRHGAHTLDRDLAGDELGPRHVDALQDEEGGKRDDEARQASLHYDEAVEESDAASYDK